MCLEPDDVASAVADGGTDRILLNIVEISQEALLYCLVPGVMCHRDHPFRVGAGAGGEDSSHVLLALSLLEQLEMKSRWLDSVCSHFDYQLHRLVPAIRSIPRPE